MLNVELEMLNGLSFVFRALSLVEPHLTFNIRHSTFNSSRSRAPMRRFTSIIVLTTLLAACTSAAPAAKPRVMRDRAADAVMLDDVERRSFHYFWDLADPHTYLIPDRAPTPSFSSIAAVGFGLTAYGIGAERGYVTRAAAAQRTLATLQSMLAMKHDP